MGWAVEKIPILHTNKNDRIHSLMNMLLHFVYSPRVRRHCPQRRTRPRVWSAGRQCSSINNEVCGSVTESPRTPCTFHVLVIILFKHYLSSMLYSCTLSNLFFKSCENWAFLQQHKCPKQNILPQGLRTYRESVYLWEELGVIKPIGLTRDVNSHPNTQHSIREVQLVKKSV